MLTFSTCVVTTIVSLVHAICKCVYVMSRHVHDLPIPGSKSLSLVILIGDGFRVVIAAIVEVRCVFITFFLLYFIHLIHTTTIDLQLKLGMCIAHRM